MWAETIDGASRDIMLGEIGPPGLALFLGQETVGLCLGFVILGSQRKADYEAHLSQFPLCLSKAFFTGSVLTGGGGLGLTS